MSGFLGGVGGGVEVLELRGEAHADFERVGHRLLEGNSYRNIHRGLQYRVQGGGFCFRGSERRVRKVKKGVAILRSLHASNVSDHRVFLPAALTVYPERSNPSGPFQSLSAPDTRKHIVTEKSCGTDTYQLKVLEMAD